jgi:hypothetical protein
MTKQRFKAYVTQAQKERDRRAAAQVLKKLVQFNALVVTPVLERVKTGGLELAAGTCIVCAIVDPAPSAHSARCIWQLSSCKGCFVPAGVFVHRQVDCLCQATST